MERDDVDAFGDDLMTLEQSLGDARSMVSSFEGEMRSMRSTMSDTGREVSNLSKSLGGGLKRSFEGLVFDGEKLSDAMKGVARSMIDSVYRSAVTPATKGLGGMIAQGVEGIASSLLPFGQGASFSQGRVVPFAQGGVVRSPTTFPMRGATGLMGEAGPEAIMPLSRGADGRLGIRSSGGGQPVSVVMNITTPDADGFRRSESQIAARMGRALSRGQRNR